MKTLLIVADQFYGESKLFFGKEFTILQASYLIPDNSTFDDCYKLFSPYTEIIIVMDSEDSTLAGSVKRLAVHGGFTGTILATICQSVADIPRLLLPENSANFTTVLKPYSSWPSLPKENEKPSKEPFPMHCLPEAAREMVTAVSDSTCTPPDFAALAALGCMAGAIGASTQLKIKDGWREFAVLWLAVVAPAGKTKSPVLSAISEPLQEIQGELFARFQQATKNHDPEKDEKKPDLEVLVYNDTTQEALFKSLANSPRGGVQISDELTGWLGSHNKYSKGGGDDRQKYLSLWSSSPVSVLRKSDGMIRIPLPVLSIVGGLTPSSLPSLHGGADDGFLSRFLISCPDKRKQVYSKIGVSGGAQYAWNVFIKHLWNLEPEINAGGIWLPATVKPSAEAEELFEKFYNDIHMVLDSETIPSLFRGSWSKAPSQVGRFALKLHCGRVACGEEASSSLVSAQTMDKAIQLMNYFLSHLSALETGFNIGATKAEEVRTKVILWLVKHFSNPKNGELPTSWSDIRHGVRCSITKPDGKFDDQALKQCLDGLESTGHVRLEYHQDKNGYDMKPLVHIHPSLSQISQ